MSEASPAAADVVVSLTNVQVQFGGGSVRAVDTVSLDVGRGEVVALVGESGCGKTTLIRAIIGLEPLAHGSIAVEGSTVGGGRRLRALRRRVQMIFQDPSGALNPRHSIYEAVAEGLRIHKVKSPRWWPRPLPRPACDRPTATCVASRTSCRGVNASA